VRIGREVDLVFVVLAGLYPILALAANNLENGIRPAHLVLPLFLTVLVAALAWVGSGLFTADRSARLLAAILVVVWFGSYGYLGDRISWTGPRMLGGDKDMWLLPAGIAVVGVAAFSILRSRRDWTNPARFCRYTISLLLLFPAFTIAAHAAAEIGRDSGIVPEPPTPLAEGLPAKRPELASAAAAAAAAPDIYLIVLDMYTGSRSLKENYGFDNRPFISGLEDRGFFIADRSRSNYAATFLSLSSLLNWSYVDQMLAAFPDDSRDRRELYRSIQDSRTTRFLRDAGYEYYFFTTPYPATTTSASADVVIGSPSSGVQQNLFLPAWIRTVPLMPFLRWSCGRSGCLYTPESAEAISWKFQRVGDLAGLSGPKFVFAHFLVPHVPFIFDADCSSRSALDPQRIDTLSVDLVRDAYIGQLACVNRKVTELVDVLLSTSERPPIILIQSDHGYGLFSRPPPIREISPRQIEERFDILAAYHLPGAGDGVVYDSISPVNVFPRVLGHYFDLDLPRHPDRSFYSSWEHPYEFVEIGSVPGGY